MESNLFPSSPQKTPSKKHKMSHENEIDEIQTNGRLASPRFFVIAGTDEEKPMRKVSPMKGHLILQGLIGKVDKVIRLSNGDLIVGVSHQAHVTNLLKMTVFDTAPVLVTPHKTMNSKKGVIRCAALRDIPEGQIAEELADQNVIEAKKITIKKDQVRIPTTTVILTFNSSVLPKEIKAGYLNVKVDQYIPNPLRCFQCFRFGHPKERCKRTAICAKCGSEDHTDDRQCTKEAKCVNCSGDHSAFSKDCPKWLEEKAIQKLKTTENISFSEARQRITPTPKPGTSFASAVKKMTSTSTQTETVGTQTDPPSRTPRQSSAQLTPAKIASIMLKSSASKPKTNKATPGKGPILDRPSKAEKKAKRNKLKNSNRFQPLEEDESYTDSAEEMVIDSSPPSANQTGGRSPIKGP